MMEHNKEPIEQISTFTVILYLVGAVLTYWIIDKMLGALLKVPVWIYYALIIIGYIAYTNHHKK